MGKYLFLVGEAAYARRTDYELHEWEGAVRANFNRFQDLPADHPAYTELARFAIEASRGVSIRHYKGSNSDVQELATLAISLNVHALDYITAACPGYADLAESAVQRKNDTLIYLDEACPEYAAIALRAIGRCPHAINHVICEDQRVFEEIATAAVHKDPHALSSVRVDRECFGRMARMAVEAQGRVLRYVPKARTDFAEIANLAVKSDGMALEFVPVALPEFDFIALTAVCETPYAFNYITSEHPRYMELQALALRVNSNAFKWLGFDHPKFFEWAKKAVQDDGMNLEFVYYDTGDGEGVGEEEYHTLAKIAVLQNPAAIEFVREGHPCYDEMVELSNDQAPAAQVRSGAKRAFREVSDVLFETKQEMPDNVYLRLNNALKDAFAAL